MASSFRSTTFADLCRANAQAHAERVAYAFSNSQAVTGSLSFGELDAQASELGAALVARCQPGDRVLLAFDSGREFVRAFFACIYAGMVAVPLNLPVGERRSKKIEAIARDAGSSLLLSDHSWKEEAEAAMRGVERHTLDELLARYGGDPFRPCAVQDTAPVFLQYTSGSTGQPKGVVVTHRSLLANEVMIRDACGHGRHTVFVGWLPLFHDMGLVGNVLQPAFLGIKSVLMPPAAFVRRPLRWLQLIAEHRGTTSGGPNFGYETCVRRIRDEDVAALDLSSWNIAFNGAEPIRAQTLKAFARKFARAGFAERAFYPVYGLAEATLFVTAPEVDQVPTLFHGASPDAAAPGSEDLAQTGARMRVEPSSARALVGCGKPRGQELYIVCPRTRRELPAGQVGEIWVRGENIAAGYWNKPELTREVFEAFTAEGKGPCMRTGDLGFIQGGELFVSGRLKDVIIVNGANHYPQDIEATVSGSAEPFLGRPSAAFGVDDPKGGFLVVAQEVAKNLFLRAEDPESLRHELKLRVRDAVLREHGTAPAHVLLVAQGSLPMTTSGKLQRSLCRELFVRGDLTDWIPLREAVLAS